MRMAPAPMQEFWTQAYNKLRKHELGHVDICVDVARDEERAIWATQTGHLYCLAFRKQVRLRADAMVSGINARQLAFDDREYGAASRLRTE